MAKKKGKKRDTGNATTNAAAAAENGPLDPATLQAALEMQAQEMEVLQAIFDRDLIIKSSTPLYAHIFCIHVLVESLQGSQNAAVANGQKESAEIILHFDFGKGYPIKQPPNIDVENKHGLSDDEVARLKEELERLALEKLGDVMIYDLVVHATEFVQEHVKDQSSFFDQMIQRQQDEEVEKKREEEQLLQLEEEEALARNQEILAMIDAERQKKLMMKKKQSARRRRRRHRSSIDIRADGDDMSSTYQSYDGEEDIGEDDEDRYSFDDDEDSDDEGGESNSDAASLLAAKAQWPGADASGGTGATGDGDADTSDSSSDSDTIGTEHAHSRYHSDFKELGLLGRGGGGEVVKARNRLDRQLYAVKKVKLDPDDPTMKKKILREVKTISRMQHRHIVRYFQAWIEGDSGDGSSDSSSDSEFGDSCSEIDEDESCEKPRPGPRWLKRQQSRESNDDDIESESVADSEESDGDDDGDDDDEDDWLGNMNNSVHMWSKSKGDRRSSKGGSRRRASSGYRSSSYMSSTRVDDGFDWEPLTEVAGEDDDSDSGRVRRSGAKHFPRIRKFGEKLYIQMEFCEGKALREVIDKGSLCQEPDKIWTLFRQILEAIVYIHKQGIIHRDIKPPNIFLDAEGTVKLGDFGLAIRPQKTTLDEEVDDEALPEDPSLEGLMRGGFGSGTANSATNAFLAQSNGSSAAEQYERLKLINLESTRMTPSLPLRNPHDLTSITTASYDPGDNITTGVGTAFYRAPEQEREGERYNQKADMFSLGILFFEMWSPPFTTLMERAQALTALREKHELPKESTLPENVKQIVLWLCQQNPAQRPSAAELLGSPFLPAKMEVEGTYLREALDTLSNPQGKFFGQLIDALLTQEPGSHIDYTYDHLETVKMKSYHNELRARSYVKRTLQKIFERHGSVEHATPLLMPRPPENNYTGVTLATPQSACSLIDSSGVSVTLPFDLTERLARFVARHNISRLKCYQFDRVYRKSVAGGGHPREFMEADFDIIWDDRGSFRFLELEGLQVVGEVISTLSTSLGSYYLRLNDARITKGIMELCRIPMSGRRELLKLLSNEVTLHVHAGVPSRIAPPVKPGRWKFFSKKLKECGVPQESIDACRPFFALPADSAATVDILEAEIGKLHTRRVSQLKANASSETKSQKQRQKMELALRRTYKDATDGIAALRNLLQGMETLRLKGPICTRVDIGLSPRPERYAAGFIFQAVLTGSQQSATLQPSLKTNATTTTSQVIAEGGRYDQLITRFKLPAAYMKASHVAAMGVRFSVDKIVSCVIASLGSKAHASTDAKCPPGSEAIVSGGRPVLICSAGKATETVLMRMQIALMLWSSGIGADFLHPDPLHLEDLEVYCAQQRIAYMIIVQNHLMREKKQVKVRAVRNSEGDSLVSCTALVEFMQERLAMLSSDASSIGYDGSSGQSTLTGGSGGGGSGRDLLYSASSAPTLQPVFDVRVVDGKHYSKENRNFKQMDTLKIVRRVSKWITSSFSGRGEDAMKVLSVDLPFGLMRELSSALMDHGAAGIDIVVANFPRYRKQIRYTADEILALDPAASGRVGRERYLLLHSLVDDRYDLMSLSNKSGAGSSSSNISSGYAGGGNRKGDRDRHVSRRSP